MSTTLSAVASVLDRGDAVAGAPVRRAGPGGDPTLVDVVHDSRAAAAGALFAALPGARTDGHEHAAAAVDAGAAALLVERPLDLDVPQLVVPSTRAALGAAAATVHGDPSSRLAVLAVTGTNGKTTTVALIEGAAAAAGLGTGVIGTTGTRVHGSAVASERTTPEATDLQRLLRRFVDRGVEVAAIEVSSHGLVLGRTAGTRVRVAGFTMLGEDHLDFHGDRESYLAAKLALFRRSVADRAVVVVDDEAGRTVAARAHAEGLGLVTLVTHGDDGDLVLADVRLDVTGGRGRLVARTPAGRRLAPTPVALRTGLLGHHNLANAALAWTMAVSAGVPGDAAAAGIAACVGVPGRLERVGDDERVVLVDYAHTPDAVRTVVAGLRALAPPSGRLAVVLGAGGDRDRGKRGPMGAAAAAADLAVLTSDNPRSEDPDTILAAVGAGARSAIADGAGATIVVEPDRRAAIHHAVAWARPGDVVLVAGKGHETGQEFADRIEEFDDRVVAADALLATADGARA